MDHVLVLYFKRHHHTEGQLGFLSYVIFYKFCCFTFYIRSMTHCELIVVKNIRSVSRFFFFVVVMGISECSNTICRREYLCSIVLSLLLVKDKLVICWLKAQHSENEDHGIQSHHFMGNRWGNSGNSVRLYFSGLQNHYRW